MSAVREWLLKSGTKEVFVRTRLLSKRSDMVPISAEQAAKLFKEADEARRGHVAELQKEVAKVATEESKVTADGLDAMSDEQLRAKAAELKIFVGPNWKTDTIKGKIRETLAADAKAVAENKVLKSGISGTDAAAAAASVGAPA